MHGVMVLEDMDPAIVEQRLAGLFPPTSSVLCAPPDSVALQKFRRLASEWPRAASYVVDELEFNRAGHRVRYLNTGKHDEQGLPIYSIEANNDVQTLFNTSSAIMKMVKRWNDVLCRCRGAPPAATTAILPQKRKLEAAAPRPLECVPPGPAHVSIYCSQEITTSQFDKAERQAQRATARQAFNRVMKDRDVDYELRFRLLAAGANGSVREDQYIGFGELDHLVEELQAAHDRIRAKRRTAAGGGGGVPAASAELTDADCEELNAIGTAHGLTLGYFRPQPHCVVVFQVTVMLDGPIRYEPPLEAGGCHAHRVLGRSLLRVCFEPLPKGAEEGAGVLSGMADGVDPHESRARREALKRRTLAEGLKVAGRSFELLVHKDADKGEDKSQLWFGHADAAPGTGKSSADALRLLRDTLLDSLSYAEGKPPTEGRPAKRLTIAKLNARLCLAFSPAVPVDKCAPNVATVLDWRGQSIHGLDALIDALEAAFCERDCDGVTEGRVQLVIVDDIVGKNTNGTIACDAKGESRLMTDGAGLMSLSVAAHIPRCTSGRQIEPGSFVPLVDVPLLAQVRVWHRGYLAKGVLMTAHTLPPGFIVLPASMVKVYGRPTWRPASVRVRSAFEVLRTSNAPSAAKMNPQLIPLLEFAGRKADEAHTTGHTTMSRLLLAMLQQQVERVIEMRSEHQTGAQLRNLLSELGISGDGLGGSGAGEMLIAGHDPLKEPYLRRKVARLVRLQLERIATGRFAVPMSLYLTGVPDFTGTLPVGTVAIVVNGQWNLQEEVLIFRNPGTHVGDVQKVACVEPSAALLGLVRGTRPELQNALVFSTQGARALADTLSGGDYDGDEFLVFRSSHRMETTLASDGLVSLVDAFKRCSQPWSEPTEAPAVQTEPAVAAAPAQLRVSADNAETCTALREYYHKLDRASNAIGSISNTLMLAQEKVRAQPSCKSPNLPTG